MPALPARTTMSNPYPAPTDAAGRAWFLGLWDSFAGLLGSAATPASARDGLLLPKRAAKNLLVNPNFKINQRGFGITGIPALGFVRDKWQLDSTGGGITSIDGGTGRLTSVDVSSKLLQTVILVSGVTYTFSNTGAAKLRVKRADDLSFIPFTTGPQTFVATSSTIPYEFAVSDGTLGTVLLEEGAFATESEQRTDEVELLLCQRTYVLMPLSARFPASGAGQFSTASFRFPVEMAGTPSGAYISGRSNSGNCTVSAPGSSLSKYGGRFEIQSTGAGDCYSLDGLYSFTV